jgi:hypothetical protein
MPLCRLGLKYVLERDVVDLHRSFAAHSEVQNGADRLAEDRGH